jgi:Leucine-rich repeat (LRR) protein
MKKITLLFAFLSCFLGNAQIIEFENLALKNYLLGIFSPGMQKASTGTATFNIEKPRQQLLYGNIHYHTDEILEFDSYHVVDTNNDGQIDVSEASVITFLDLDGFIFESSPPNSNGVSDLQYFTNLKYLGLASATNTSADISIDLSQNTSLEMLILNFARLNNLDFSQNIALTHLSALRLNHGLYDNLIFNSDFSNLDNLVFLDISHMDPSENLNLQGKPLLKDLYYINSGLSEIDVSQNTALEYLVVYSIGHYYNGPFLTNLDVSQNTSLKVLYCSGNLINELNLSQNSNLEIINCHHNQLSELDFTQNLNLKFLHCNDNQISELNVTQNVNLENLICHHNQLSELDVTQNAGLISLSCSYNDLTVLDVTQNSNLERLDCIFNDLTVLDFTQNSNLEWLDCSINDLTALDVTQNSNLEWLDCSFNDLTALDVTQNSNLERLDCFYNDLTALDVTQNSNLERLDCSINDLTTLDVTQNSNLANLTCEVTKLETLDISSCPNLYWLNAENNPLLTHVNIKNNLHNFANLQGCSILVHVCADDDETIYLDSSISEFVLINSYCDLLIGGDYFEIEGNALIGNNETNCTDSEVVYPFLKFNVSNGFISGTFFANQFGNYYLPVNEATHIITPEFENSNYFNVSPESITVEFPATESPFEQHFCVTPNGIYHDLETTIIPLGYAVPGFDASYKILYKNKGNQPENPSLTFTYDDDVLDFLSSSVVPNTTMSGLLSWDLEPLNVFESGFIIVNFNLNTHMETPPLNSGDILNFQALIMLGGLLDETPENNTFILNQTVVNSFDPNDKTCLEGKSIHPDMIGEYVHYRIRFENLGTFPAQNVVIEDTIDAEKFDIATLQMVDASHDCRTQIIGQKVSFIFDNIQLDFNDETNDGYVVFKIKTLSTLTLNSTISNTAEIYFDFNFPIITNTETSTFEILIPENDISENEFVLHPNPAKNMLTITSIHNIEIQNVDIYNPQGQLVLTVQNPSNAVDVSNLTSGTYFVKVRTNRGTSNTKFVKE